MSRHINLVMIAMLTIGASCGSNGNMQSSLSDQNVITDTLFVNKVLPIDFDVVTDMMVTDSILWVVSEKYNDNILFAFDLDGTPIAKGLGIGQGQDELLEVTNVSFSDRSDEINIYDARGGKLYTAALIAGSSIHLSTLVSDINLLDGAMEIDNGQFFIAPVNSNTSYKIIDSDKEVIDSICYFPPKPKNVDERIHHLACTGQIFIAPRKTTFVRNIVYDGGLDFFGLGNGKISHLNRFSVFDMAYSTLNNSIEVPVPNEESRTGYCDVYMTEDYCYAIFSDEYALDNVETLGDIVDMFTHDGTLVKKFILPSPTSNIVVDKTDQNIFVVLDNDDKCTIAQLKTKH